MAVAAALDELNWGEIVGCIAGDNTIMCAVRSPEEALRVMEKLGMTYRYSYVEQWQPKDLRVTFRLYQLDLDGQERPAYPGYWDTHPEHWVEEIGRDQT